MNKPSIIRISIIILCIFLFPVNTPEFLIEGISPEVNAANRSISECTTAIISGNVTTDGRALLWKNRDMNNPDQEFAYFDDGEYSYITNISAGQTEDAWGGVNSTGFAIENSTALNLPDTVAGPDDDGRIMKLALQTCQTVDDFITILDSTNEQGRTTPSNYGVIDAEGSVALFEAGAGSFIRIDAADEDDGFLVRANFAFSGADSGRIGQWRYDRACQMIIDAIEGDTLTAEYLICNVINDLSLEDLDPYPLPYNEVYEAGNLPVGFIPTLEAINREITVSAVVMRGVLENENPLLSTLFALPGQPVLTVPIPLWVGTGSTPVELDGDSTSSLCDLAKRFFDRIYDPYVGNDALNTFQLLNNLGSGLLMVANPVTVDILTRTQDSLEIWRDNMPEPQIIADFQNELAGYALEELSDWQSPTLRRIPEDLETIPEAVIVSAYHDTVLVSPGVYPGPIEYLGRNITIGSLFLTTGNIAYIDSTIIDGGRAGRSAAVFTDGENEDAILTGFTFQNCQTGFGGGVYCNDANPTLKHLIIKDNVATRNGGGIYCTRTANPTISKVTLIGNRAIDQGGSIYCFNENSSATVINSIMWNNQPAVLPQWLTITYCDVEGGYAGEGNIDVDPLFCEPDSGDFHLSWADFPDDNESKSPCIDTGDPNSCNDSDSTRADMGAYHFDQGLPQDISVEPEALEFIDIQTGDYVRQSITISNIGDRLLVVNSQSIIMIEGPPFIYVSSGGGRFELGSAGNHETVITFAPILEALYNAVFRIESNDPYEGIVEIPITGTCLGVGIEPETLPEKLNISAIYPNPFNLTTVIVSELPIASYIKVNVFNISGQQVAVIKEGHFNAGRHSFSWDAKDVPDGIYIVRLMAAEDVCFSKVIVVK